MKKIYGFLGAATLLALGACSNDTLDGPSAPNLNEGQKGDLFMTMNVSMASQVGSRTSTPEQGFEIGKDRENTISSAVIILATGDETTGYKVKFVSANIPSSGMTNEGVDGTIPGDPGHGDSSNPEGIEPDLAHSNQYKASFTFDRQTLLTDVKTGEDVVSGDNHQGATKKKSYTIFVIANPTAEIVTKLNTAASSNGDLQDTFEAITNDEFWKDNRFLMTSAVPATHTIFDNEIEEGTCTTKETAYNLGTVKIQRAMSRFDLDLESKSTNFEGTGNDTSSPSGLQSNIHVEFDAVAMVNMAQSAYLFKVMGADERSLGSANPPIHFGDERESTYQEWWTVTPSQTAYHNQLFTNFKFGGTDGTDPEASTGNLVALASFFGEGKDFQVFNKESWEEDNSYEHTGHQTPSDYGAYRIWRYCMENTNPWEAKNQINGNSTGIIYRAKLTDTNTTNSVIPTTYLGSDTQKKGEAVYAYGNVILGTAEQLFNYAMNPKSASDNTGVYENVSPAYWEVVKSEYAKNWDESSNDYKQKNDNDWWVEIEDNQNPLQPGEAAPGGTKRTIYHHGNLNTEDIEAALVEAGFSIYRPTNVNNAPVYYCYYLYWNRHNDNGKNTIMGNMEFATVRNNPGSLRR